MERILNTWAGLASHFIGECFDVAKPYLDKDFTEIDPYIRFVSTQLFIDCHLSSESSILLVQATKEWDADIINRSIMEGTIKYVFMMSGNELEAKQKAYEFWDKLPSYASIKHHDRALSFLNLVDNPDAPEWIPFKKLLLTQDEIDSIRAGTNKKERHLLDQKWSFSEITKSFAQSDSPGLKHLSHLAHGYGMSSHLIHKDGDGVGMVWERYGRSETDQYAVKLGHYSRIISDICSLSTLRLFQLLKFCKKDTSAIRDIERRYSLLFNELEKAGKYFTEVEYGTEIMAQKNSNPNE